ncbi:hypothetical protein GH714_006887 [Hevea brasiliensis]|uniref:DCD domain-containing protein n=1 Tax=Hevea brasiliensis TaxID=3981 RepID=A0A6A6LT35_HEVBR|nr:hypothetical protein GH714_006887 [Hevea brasiliensis]
MAYFRHPLMVRLTLCPMPSNLLESNTLHSPLPESEFRGAIRENYFSAYKFNFGLSEKQVRKLLLFFSLRKLKDKCLQRHFTNFEVGCPMRNGLKLGHESGPLVSNEQVGDPMGVRRFFYDIRFVTRNAMRIEHNVDIDPMSVVMTNNLGHATPSKADHITTGMISGLEDKWNEQNGFGMQISSEYPCLYQSISPVHSSKSKFEENSLVNSQHQLSMESQNLNIFNSTTCGDATISSALTALPYYTDASVLNYRHSSLLECTLHNSIFPCLENESLSSYMESKCTSRSGIISSGLSANVPNVLSRCPVPYQYMCLSQGPNILKTW